ncbi:hypothetical protein GY45DRAFT_1312659 [Cubamyces sp. BRFM 1775]|nr:hypothetical protein GY45DRAFT_1312659 [Cubamyces sp. BRFM 1775]
MPRLGSESNSPVRRHSPNQTLSNYFQVNYQVWQIRSSGPSRTEPEPRADPGPSTTPPPSTDPQLDALDGLLNRTRASASRTRWNARSSGSPYGHRPLHKWLPSEQKHIEELSALVEMFPDPSSEDEHDEDKALHEPFVEDLREDEAEEADEEDDAGEESDWEEADLAEPSPPQPHTHTRLSSSSIAARKRERNKKKRAKARAKAKEKMKLPAPPDPVRDAPKDLLMSMSRIAQLVGSLNADPPDERNELIKRFREAFGEASGSQLGSLPAQPSQWRAEVLQSVRRMETMLGQMEKWQAQVAPGEIEALREETARLEVRVRAVVEHKERERKVLQTAVRTAVEAKLGNIPGFTIDGAVDDSSEAKDEVQSDVAETAETSDGDELVVTNEGSLIQSGANGEEDGAASISDSLSVGTSCPSEPDTGPTGLKSDERSVQEDKAIPVDPPPAKPPPHTPHTAHTTNIAASISPIVPASAPSNPPHQPIFKFGSASATPLSISSAPSSVKPFVPAPATAPRPATVLPSTVNLNVPPAAPAKPIEHLKNKPWSMVEVLFLLEVVAHFPPAEHGWTFIAEAYNNILITRPLQEWFGKQAATSNEEEAKMKTVLQKMHTEARLLRTRGPEAKADAASAEQSKAGQRGKRAPFGSAKARAEADARGKHPANAAFDEDTLFLTRLPHPFPPPAGKPVSAADNPAIPPPAQRIVVFPRRRPPFSLPSEDARAFARVMASAAAGVRPPSGESRAAMLALYSATKSRYPVRTAWDCWHRWCTPWVVQDADDPSRANADPDTPPTVLDYIAGNLCLPAGTWLAQPQGFVYRPIPGTYPDAPGVQHKVIAGFDPRPGMVAFARMAHLYAERTWAGVGLKRKPDGTVAEEVLVGRRAKLPGTLAGIWPGKVINPPAKSAANARPAAPGAAAQPPVAQTAATPQQATAPPAPQQAAASAAAQAAEAAAAAAATQPASSAPAPALPASAPTTAPAPVTAQTNTTTPAPPRLAPLPLPQPRKPPPADPPCVPEGTLGNRTRPGMAAWFERAAVRADVLERVTGMREARRGYMRAMEGAGGEGEEEVDEGEEERGRRVPLHLREMVLPPVPPIRKLLWARPGLGVPARGRRV